MREIPIQSAEPLWRQAISGAQILFVAFGALVLVPLLTGLNPSLALHTFAGNFGRLVLPGTGDFVDFVNKYNTGLLNAHAGNFGQFFFIHQLAGFFLNKLFSGGSHVHAACFLSRREHFTEHALHLAA